MRRIHVDSFLKLSAGIRFIRADPRTIPQRLIEHALGNRLVDDLQPAVDDRQPLAQLRFVYD